MDPESGQVGVDPLGRPLHDDDRALEVEIEVVELGVEDAMLAFGMNGEPLPVEHGFPVRMVVPGLREPLRFTAALADGQHLYAFRYAANDNANTLYYRTVDEDVVVVSEPLDKDQDIWNPVPTNHMLIARAGKPVAATVSPTTSAIQKPCAPMACTGRQGVVCRAMQQAGLQSRDEFLSHRDGATGEQLGFQLRIALARAVHIQFANDEAKGFGVRHHGAHMALALLAVGVQQ